MYEIYLSDVKRVLQHAHDCYGINVYPTGVKREEESAVNFTAEAFRHRLFYIAGIIEVASCMWRPTKYADLLRSESREMRASLERVRADLGDVVPQITDGEFVVAMLLMGYRITLVDVIDSKREVELTTFNLRITNEYGRYLYAKNVLGSGVCDRSRRRGRRCKMMVSKFLYGVYRVRHSGDSD